jgi:hypothetical protein
MQLHGSGRGTTSHVTGDAAVAAVDVNQSTSAGEAEGDGDGRRGAEDGMGQQIKGREAGRGRGRGRGVAAPIRCLRGEEEGDRGGRSLCREAKNRRARKQGGEESEGDLQTETKKVTEIDGLLCIYKYLDGEFSLYSYKG